MWSFPPSGLTLWTLHWTVSSQHLCFYGRLAYSRCGHYIFTLWFLTFFLLSVFYRLISAATDWMSTILPHMVWPYCEFRMQVWNVLHAARWKCRTQINHQKIRHLGTIAQLCQAISSQLRHVSTIGKKNLSSNISSRCVHNMVNFGLLAAEIGLPVWGTPANFNGFRVLAALLHGTLVVAVSQSLRRWTVGATYIRQGDHHVGNLPIF